MQKIISYCESLTSSYYLRWYSKVKRLFFCKFITAISRRPKKNLQFYQVIESQNLKQDFFLTLQFKIDSMSFSKSNKLETTSRKSTEQDSGSDKDEEFFHIKTNPQKHKTQLCKTFSELGYCPYQFKCRFAHGKHELVRNSGKGSSKNRRCNGFWKNGSCPYGSRCQFGHAQTNWEDGAILLGLQAVCSNEGFQFSKLLKIML